MITYPPPRSNWQGSVEEWVKYLEQKGWEEYERRFATQVLENVRFFKKKQKLTVKKLVEKLEVAGWQLSVSSLNGTLGSKGRAFITIPEALAFARALEVSPIEIMLPLNNGSEIEIGMYDETHPYDAYRYIVGAGSTQEQIDEIGGYRHRSLLGISGDFGLIRAFERHENLVAKVIGYHRLWFAEQEVRRLVPGVKNDPGYELSELEEQSVAALVSLSEARTALRARGAVPPEVPSTLAFVDDDQMVMPNFPITGLATERSINDFAMYIMKENFG